MTKQITIRLPDEQVNFLDAEVSAGEIPSRAAGIARALRREQRRRRAEEDLHTMLGEDDPDLTALADWAANRAYPALD